MSLMDKNKIFFGLIHYILSEQKNVDWVLKTSLINFVGLSGGMSNKGYQSNSIVDNIIDYIYQVKPYHVQFAEFIEKFKNDIEIVNVDTDDVANTTLSIRYDALSTKPDKELVYDYETSLEPENVKYKWLDTNMANRLYLTKTKDEDEIMEIMNSYFKGLTISGGEFDIERFGYEEFLYESALYDSPTIEYDYMMVNFNENTQVPYEKKFVLSGKSVFEFEYEPKSPVDIVIEKENLITGEKKRIDDRQVIIQDNRYTIDIFTGIEDYDKVTIYVVDNFNQENDREFIYVATPFEPSDSNILFRDYKQLEENVRLPMPEIDIDREKIVILRETKDKIRTRITNFTKEDTDIIIFDTLDEFDTIIMVVLDYKFVYDKVYAWDDRFGRSNNLTYQEINGYDTDDHLRKVTRLSGDKFLRANYEYDRPSELTVSYPQSSFTSYKYDDNGNVEVFRMNYKNDMLETQLSQTSGPTIEEIFETNGVVSKIRVSDVSKLVTTDNLNMALVNSEIIGFTRVNEEDNSILGLMRGIGGSVISNLKVGDKLYPYVENSWTKIPFDSKNVSHKVKFNGDGTELVLEQLSENTNYTTYEIKDGETTLTPTFREYNGKMYKCVEKNTSPIDFENTEEFEAYMNKYWKEMPDGSCGFDCPTGITKNHTISVYKLPILHLAKDFKKGDTEMLITLGEYDVSVLGLEQENGIYTGKLYIGDDIIDIKKAEITENGFLVSDFTMLPSKYANEEIIYSKDENIYSAVPYEMSSDYYYTDLFTDYYIGTYTKTKVRSTGYITNERGEKIFEISKSGVVYTYVTSTDDDDTTKEEFGYIDNDIIYDKDDNEVCKIVRARDDMNSGEVYKAVRKLIITEQTHCGETILINAYLKNKKITDFKKVEFILTPEDANLTVKYDGTTTSDKVVELNRGSKLSFTVSKEGYFPVEYSMVVDCDKTVYVKLDKEIKLVITAEPPESKITITEGGMSSIVASGSINVFRENSIITYSIEKLGYEPVVNEVVLTEDKNLNIVLDKKVFVNDFDYLVLRYIWTQGKDLDTETAIVNAPNLPDINGKYVGWKTSSNGREGPSVPRGVTLDNSVLYWSGDNTTEASEQSPREENILVSAKNILKEDLLDKLPNEIEIDMQATWYSIVGQKPVKLEIMAYKGGRMYSSSDYRYYNEGGEQIKFIDENGQEQDSVFIETNKVPTTLKQYAHIGKTTINKETQSAVIELV
jgi:hypothetical protein